MRVARGVESALETQSYPTTTDTFITEHGDLELNLPDGTITVGQLLAHLPDQEIETEEDARLTIYWAFGEAAIGRKGYSDRDPPSHTEATYRPISF